MHVHLSTSPIGDVFSTWTAGYRPNPDKDLPHFVWENITFGDWNDERKIDLDVKMPPVSCLSFMVGDGEVLTVGLRKVCAT